MNDPRVPVCIRSDYQIRLENVAGRTFAHSAVRRWNATVKRALEDDWNRLFEMHGGPIFALNEPHGDQKHQKFLRMFGFEFLKAIQTQDGERFVFVRSR